MYKHEVFRDIWRIYIAEQLYWCVRLIAEIRQGGKSSQYMSVYSWSTLQYSPAYSSCSNR